MSEQYRVNHQRVSISVKDSTKTKVVGIENNLTNYSAFIPPEPNSPEGMYCQESLVDAGFTGTIKSVSIVNMIFKHIGIVLTFSIEKLFSIRGFFKRIVLDLVVWLPHLSY